MDSDKIYFAFSAILPMLPLEDTKKVVMDGKLIR